MCGILGGITIEPLATVTDPDRFGRAIDCLAHRGPDDRGQVLADGGRSFLGHRRLSIIDLAGGKQPIPDETEQRHLCYNGEIYNFRALREALIARGHRFRTQTDGEVALHLYQENPRGFVTQLQGMFGLAILDGPDQRLTLVRDRNGIKPLYYHHDGPTLIFGSELKAILALLPEKPAVSAHVLQQYLRWKYIPAPLTIYEKIYQLPPAYRLVATRNVQDGRIDVDIQPYWDFDTSGEKLIDEREAIEMLDRKLRSVVESHLESDVEIGALLSGGVDSSLVVAMAATISKRRIRTFSVGFRETGFDQLPFARKLAERYDTHHVEEYVDLDPAAAVPTLVRHFDEPFADSSALACYRVCQVAARHVKVALTGDGGDETFAGYNRYEQLVRAIRDDSAFRRLTNRAVVASAAVFFSPEAKFLKRARTRSYTPLRQHEEHQVLCSPWLARRLLTERYRHADGEDYFNTHRSAALDRNWDPVDVAQYVDSRMYLPGDILTKVDRTSMASSLECRPPLLDHTISEFAATLPIDMKIRNGTRKYLLKKLAERYVPSELLYRPKMGFRVPIRRWFKRGLLDQTADLLQDGALVAEGIIDPAGLRWVLRNQPKPWMNFSSLLWALLCLEHWARVRLES